MACAGSRGRRRGLSEKSDQGRILARGKSPTPARTEKQRLIVAPRAETDLRESFLWYEERSRGLGHAFLECVEAKLNVIAAAPQLFRPRFGAYRLAATKRFPYGIYFIWDEASALVTVRRVLHFKQDRRARLRSS